MTNLDSKTVAEVVTENIKTAHVFKKYGIDFCCGGGITIQKACEKHNVDIDTLNSEIMSAMQNTEKANNYQSWSLPFLVDYIVNNHHEYVRESIVLLNQYTDKVLRVHGAHHEPLFKIKKLYDEVANEMTSHMMKEERILFPFIKELVAAKENGLPCPKAPFGTVGGPISMMEMEHETAGEICVQIAELTNQYQAPEWACNTFKAMYSKLDEFEQDLHIHVHLENNILFPKALEIERELSK